MGHKKLIILLVQAGADQLSLDYRDDTPEAKCNGNAAHAFYELRGLRFEAMETYEGQYDRYGKRYRQVLSECCGGPTASLFTLCICLSSFCTLYSLLSLYIGIFVLQSRGIFRRAYSPVPRRMEGRQVLGPRIALLGWF